MASKKELKREIDEMRADIEALKLRVVMLEAHPSNVYQSEGYVRPFKITWPYEPTRTAQGGTSISVSDRGSPIHHRFFGYENSSSDVVWAHSQRPVWAD